MKNFIFGFVVATLLIILGLISWNYLSDRWSFGITTVTRLTSETITSEIQDIAELSTVVYIYQNIAALERYATMNLFSDDWRWPGTTRLLHVKYIGEVRFGIDFDGIIVDVDNFFDRITVILPPARIMTHVQHLDEIEYLDDTRGVFTRRRVYDIPEAFINSRNEIQERLIREGMLERARKNAQNLIRMFIEGMINQVDVDYELIIR